MPRLPWEKWFWSDWLGDHALTGCAPATRGIWADWLGVMHESNSGGVLTGDVAQLARWGRCTPKEAAAALADLKAHDAARVTGRVTGNVTVENRRRRRAAKSAKSNAQRQKEHRDKKKDENSNGKSNARSNTKSNTQSNATDAQKLRSLDKSDLKDQSSNPVSIERLTPLREKLAGYVGADGPLLGKLAWLVLAGHLSEAVVVDACCGPQEVTPPPANPLGYVRASLRKAQANFESLLARAPEPTEGNP